MLIKKLHAQYEKMLKALFAGERTQILLHLDKVRRAEQILLKIKYQEIANSNNNKQVFTLQDVEFSAYSQNGEDGILLYIFSLIGTSNQKAVEIGSGDSLESNTTNLSINHGWKVLGIDSNAKNIQKATRFFRADKNAFKWTRNAYPVLVNKLVKPTNVNQILVENDFINTIDLLSIDIDGADYWVLKAIDVVKPRVIVAEFNNNIPYNKPYTIDPMKKPDVSSGYFGASLNAFNKLLSCRNYYLIGANSPKTNAFWLLKSEKHPLLKKKTPKEILESYHSLHKWSGPQDWVKV